MVCPDDSALSAQRTLIWVEKDGGTGRILALPMEKQTYAPQLLRTAFEIGRCHADASPVASTSPANVAYPDRWIAWINRRRLLAWQRGWPAARVVTETEEGTPVTWPKVSGDTVSWVADRTYTADLRSGSFAPMTKQWGAAEAWGDRFLHIGVPAGSGDGFHLDTSTLPPLPGCR